MEHRFLAGGRYVLERLLGSGGMAAVWTAWDTRLDVRRAVKVLHPHLAVDTLARRRFETEARVIAALDHPNVVSVHDFGEDEGRLWIVMDLARGGCVQSLVQTGPLPARPAAEIVAQVLDALEAAHARGVIHRDVKPGNILLSEDGHALLADFGVARMRDAHTLLTTEGARLGTWVFMAPELRSDAVNAGVASDVYAAGATLFSLLSGRNPPDMFLPFDDEDPLRDLPPELAGVIRRATARRPEDRYPTAAAMAAELRSVAAGQPEATLALPPVEGATIAPTAARPAPRWRPIARIVGILAAVALVGAAVRWGADRDSAAGPIRPAPLPRFTGIEAVARAKAATWCGGHLWISNEATDAIHELDPTTGGVLRTVPGSRAGDQATYGLACVGADLLGVTFPGGRLVRYAPARDAFTDTGPDLVPYTHGLEVVGDALFYADGGDHGDYDGFCEGGELCHGIVRADAAGRTRVRLVSDVVPGDLEWVGSGLLATRFDGHVLFLDTDLKPLGPPLGPPWSGSRAMAWDGRRLWVAQGGVVEVVPEDGDGDGHTWWPWGGDDCDDADPGVHGAAWDVPGNGVDEDCDGWPDWRTVAYEGFEEGVPGDRPEEIGPWSPVPDGGTSGTIVDDPVRWGDRAVAMPDVHEVCTDLAGLSGPVAMEAWVWSPGTVAVNALAKLQIRIVAGGVRAWAGFGGEPDPGRVVIGSGKSIVDLGPFPSEGWHRLRLWVDPPDAVAACVDDACARLPPEAIRPATGPELACACGGDGATDDDDGFAFDELRVLVPASTPPAPGG